MELDAAAGRFLAGRSMPSRSPPTSADKMERKFSIELYGRHAIPEGGVRESDADKAERNRDAGSFFLRKDEEEYITS
uniref:Uncharacterized protein n=1 Tax=Oryza rufipogon TaxID=4529 RepID=A0A0E0NUF8_ORYRU